MPAAVTIWVVIYIAANALLAIPVAIAATAKGRSAGGFFLLSFFFSFIVGVLVLIAMPKVEREPTITTPSGNFAESANGQLVKCPYCAEWVKSEAKVCKHCGKEISKKVASMAKEDAETLRSMDEARNAELAASLLAKQEADAARKAKAAAFFASKRNRILLAAGASIVVLLGITAGVVATIQTSDQKAQVKASIAKMNDWGTNLKTCGNLSTYNASASSDNSSVSFDFTLPSSIVGYATGNNPVDVFMNCLGANVYDIQWHKKADQTDVQFLNDRVSFAGAIVSAGRNCPSTGTSNLNLPGASIRITCGTTGASKWLGPFHVYMSKTADYDVNPKIS